MPKINDIVEITQALETKKVVDLQDRCVVVRNRNSSCTRCADACPVGAITLGENRFALDNGACVACGACTTVCPTEALIPAIPTDDALLAAIAAACTANGGGAAFACARIAARKVGDPERFAEVPCLARMEESLLVELASRGIEDILLVDGDCSTCKFHACSKGIDKTVGSANTLLEAVGSGIRVHRRTGFPDELLEHDTAGRYGASRRGFFQQAKGTAADAMVKAVKTTIKSSLQMGDKSVRDRFGLTESGTVPQFEVKRRMDALDALDRIGPPVVPEIETRLWGSVEIDHDRCNACTMCAVFCPTGALKKVEESVDGKLRRSLEFSLAECVQCRLCADICLKKCLVVGSTISTEELFDFEPRTIPLK